MQIITYEDALRALNEAVKDRGYDYVYPREKRGACYNVFEGKPDCIVGWVLIHLGVPIEWFEPDTRDNDDVADTCKNLLAQSMFEFTEDAKRLLADAQHDQDSGSTWGVAVTRAHLGGDWFDNLLHRDAA